MLSPITVDVAGDICMTYCRLKKSDAFACAESFNECWGKADYRIANLEAPFVNVPLAPIDKIGPNLSTPSKFMPFFEHLEVDGYALANNHMGDFGPAGIKNTLDVLHGLGKDFAGASDNYEDAYRPIRKTIKNVKVSVFSFCENEFGTAAAHQGGAAGYDRAKAKQLIKREQSAADAVIIIFHGGCEHCPFPSPEQRQRYHDLIDWGAKAVVGMHSHCLQGMEYYNDAPIFYGVGNCYFPLDKETVYEGWHIGALARLTVNADKIIGELVPFIFDDNDAEIKQIRDNGIRDYFAKISAVAQSDTQADAAFKAWAVISGENLEKLIAGYCGDKNLPKNICGVRNLFSCEAHNEVMREYFRLKCDDKIETYNDFTIKKYMRIRDWMNDSDKDSDNSHKTTNDFVVLWGISKKTAQMINEFSGDNEIVIIDRDKIKQGLRYKGITVQSPDTAIKCHRDARFVLCTDKRHHDEIATFLKSSGVMDICYADDFC